MRAWFSYHGGHSGQFCRHARGRLEALVEMACARGFTQYGLSEHGPRWRPEDLFPGEEDLGVEGVIREFSDYAREADALAQRWEGRLELLVGFETEVLPPDTWAEDMAQVRQQMPRCDYVVGSAHHIAGFCIDFDAEQHRLAAEAVGGEIALQVAYFDQLAEVATALRPQVLGHFDLVRKFDPKPHFQSSVWPAIRRALEAALEADCLLDLNAGAFRRGLGPVYPSHEILALARRMGLRVTLGDDAHAPADVGVGLDASVSAAAAAGYREIHRLVRRDGATVAEAVPIEAVGSAA